MHQMIAGAAVIKDSLVCKESDRCFAVTIHAAFRLRVCLADMRINRRLVLVRERGDLFNELFAAGILRMEAKPERCQRVPAVQLVVPFFEQGRRLTEVVDAPDLHQAHPHIAKRFRDRFRRQIHFHRAGDAAGQILENGKL